MGRLTEGERKTDMQTETDWQAGKEAYTDRQTHVAKLTQWQPQGNGRC